METAEQIQRTLNVGDWVTSIDFKDAYYHILVHPSYQKFLQFAIGNKVFQYRALPMGLKSSPRVFTGVIKCVKGYLQQRGIDVHQYLDDWLIRARSAKLAEENTKTVLKLVEDLGFVIILEKSELKPTQQIVYLGASYVLQEGIV